MSLSNKKGIVVSYDINLYADYIKWIQELKNILDVLKLKLLLR